MMALQQELNLPHPVEDAGNEAALNIVLTGELLSKEADRILKPFKITQAQFNVLMLLRFQSEKGELNQTRLGRMLLVNRSNVTGIVDRMERDGLVDRVAEPGDRRVKMVKISEAGRKACEKAAKTYFSRIEQIIGPLGTNGVKELCRQLDRIRAAINEPSGKSSKA